MLLSERPRMPRIDRTGPRRPCPVVQCALDANQRRPPLTPESELTGHALRGARYRAQITSRGQTPGMRSEIYDIAIRAGFADRAADVAVALTELVANAQQHGEPPYLVEAWWDGRLVIEVSNQGTGLDGESVWRLLKNNLNDKAYSFDATLVPDGGYQVKVVASDAPSHTPADALKSEKISDRFSVDTTPAAVGMSTASPDTTLAAPGRSAGVARHDARGRREGAVVSRDTTRAVAAMSSGIAQYPAPAVGRTSGVGRHDARGRRNEQWCRPTPRLPPSE